MKVTTAIKQITKTAMTSQSESPPPRPRGRPRGSRDSYPRERRYKKMPPANVVTTLMPAIRELLDNANAQGYNRALGVAPKRDQEAVDRSVTKLLAAIRRLLDVRD